MVVSGRLRSACLELISTEATYVETLETIVEVFMKPLRTWAYEDSSAGASRNGGVTIEEINILFGSVETLLGVNSGLRDELRRVEQSLAPETLALTMVHYACGPLRLYAPHVSRFPAVCALLQRLLERSAKFKAAVRVLELQPKSRGLTLQALLVNTVQRLPRYMLLLREILKNTPADAVSARDTLDSALDKIHAVTVGVRSPRAHRQRPPVPDSRDLRLTAACALSERMR
jgi:hypothetical protein